jgi:hypothetical protein
LENEKSDSTDKRCVQLLNDFYICFESDEGQANPLMITTMMKLFEYKDDLNLPNRQLAVLLYQYINSVSQPEKALIWINALMDEYYKVYKQSNPLILLYEGESLINSHRQVDAHAYFMKFFEQFPKSVTAMCYIYETEPDKNLSKTWLGILKAQHPNHWMVKQYPEL